MNVFWKENDLVPGGSRWSRTPSATSSSSTMGSLASNTYVHSILIWRMFIYFFSKINLFKMVPTWSWCPRTPSATSTSSTLESTASTSYVHQKLAWRMMVMVLYYFSKTNQFKMVPASYRLIKMLSDTSSDLIKLNHGTCCTRHG